MFPFGGGGGGGGGGLEDHPAIGHDDHGQGKKDDAQNENGQFEFADKISMFHDCFLFGGGG